MTTNIETLLKVLIANGHTDLITHSILLDNKAIEPVKIGTKTVVNVSSRTLDSHGLRAVGNKDNSWIYIDAEVIAYNENKISNRIVVKDCFGTIHTLNDLNETKVASRLEPIPSELEQAS